MVDRECFSRTKVVPALQVHKRQCQALLNQVKGHLLERQGLKPVVHAPGKSEERLILLDGSNKDELPDEVKKAVDGSGATVIEYEVNLTYDNFKADEVLRTLLPDGVEAPRSFECVGHIAHVNLKEEQEPYKNLIGQVLLDKNRPTIRTVVNKVQAIENEYRVANTEVIAGENDLTAEVNHLGARIRLNYGEVYWNSRLQTEHRRIVHQFKPLQVVSDMFCGVGPFAIPAAKMGCRVHANDLNPRAVAWLRENARVNGIEHCVHAHNMCGKEFLRHLGNSGHPFHHLVMNLPASAVDFLPHLRGLCLGDHWKGWNTPTVHCYTFAKGEESIEQAKASAAEMLGASEAFEPSVHVVRDVAPEKLMLRLTFRLPADVAYADSPPSESGW